MSRTYTKRQRAESEAATRARILEATMTLHEELGPRRTTVSAIAERAGVQRLTVYRHFPDETGLFQACTACWLERNPPPAAAPDPAAAPEAVLTELYAYYRRTEKMWTVSFRDEALVPAIQAPMAQFRAHLAELAEHLAARLGEPHPGHSIALGHAVMFTTWSDLAGRGLDDAAIARLAMAWIRAS